MDLQAVAQELYGLAPAEFIAARDALAVQAREGGDRQLAAAIKQLKRPSAAAWLANVLARQRSDRVDELIAIGDRLRDAQRRLAGAELKDLAKTGRGIVGEMVDEAARLAFSAGQRPTASTMRQLQDTLEAALAEAESGRQLRSGRLTVALSYAGLGSADLGPGDEQTAVNDRDEIASDRATDDLHISEQRLAELTAALQSAHRLRDRVHDQVDELERQLRQVRSQESEAAQRVQDLESEIAAVQGEVSGARSRLGR